MIVAAAAVADVCGGLGSFVGGVGANAGGAGEWRAMTDLAIFETENIECQPLKRIKLKANLDRAPLRRLSLRRHHHHHR